jgi:hypothetical protein
MKRAGIKNKISLDNIHKSIFSLNLILKKASAPPMKKKLRTSEPNISPIPN